MSKITQEIKARMLLNARLRPGWERLEALAKLMDMQGNRVLDIGIHGDVWPGGHAYMFENATYETLDIDPNVLPTHVQDIRKTTFEDDTFDMVICYAVVEHILENRNDAYKEILRILKPGGIAIIEAPSTLERESEPAKIVTYQELVDAFGENVDINKLSNGDYFLEVTK
jgi:SAM-dependent methyltransferase